MANNNSPFKKVSPLRSADKYLREVEELMRLNRGGGMLIGYDTDTNRPIYLPGKVANPTGLDDYAGKSILNLPKINPSEDDIYSELASLESILGLQDTFDSIETPSTVDVPEPYIPPETDINTPRLPPSMLQENNPPRIKTVNVPKYPAGSLGESMIKWASIPDSDIESLTDPESIRVARAMKNSAQIFFRNENQPNIPESIPTPTPTQPYDEAAKNRIKDNLSSMVPQTENINISDMQFQKPSNNPIKSARMALGNFVESVGDAIPGIGEHGVSEFIAGGPTRHTGQVNAAENINISEPENKSFQAGAGIENLQQSTQPGNLQRPSRPAVSSINPAAPVVGNFAGIPASAVQTANKGMSQVVNNPAMMSPANPTSPSFANNGSKTVSSNQPQNQSSNQNQSYSAPSSNRSQTSYSAPAVKKSVVASNNYIPPKQTIPMSTVGVGSVAPAPVAPKPSSSNVFSSVVNAIKNLFKRK